MTVLGAETKPIGTAAFNMIASGEPIRWRPLHGQTQTTTVQTLIVCMPTYAPSPVSPDMPVSLVAKVHARKVLDDTRIEEALAILERMKIPPIAIDPELIHKIWLIQQVPLPSELCARLACTVIKDSLSARLTDTINHEASRTRNRARMIALLMNATITALDLPNLPRRGHGYYGVLNAL